MTCQQCTELMVDALYRELLPEEKKEFDEHITSCADCALSFHKMQATLNLMNKRTRPEPDNIYWNSYWNQVQNKLESEDSSRIIPFTKKAPWRPARIQAWAYGIAAVLLVTFGIYLGKTYFVNRGIEDTQQESIIAQRGDGQDTLNTQAMAYLERSKNLLLGLVNIDDEHLSTVDLVRQQDVSRQLVKKAYYLKAALSDPDQQRMKQLIGDLEVILLELANVEVKPGKPAIELVKKGVDQKSILLKINLEEMRATVKKPPQKKNVRPNL